MEVFTEKLVVLYNLNKTQYDVMALACCIKATIWLTYQVQYRYDPDFVIDDEDGYYISRYK